VDWTREKIARKEIAMDKILEWEPEGKRMQRRRRERCEEAGVPTNRLRRSLILSVAHSVNLCVFGCYGIVDWTRERLPGKRLLWRRSQIGNQRENECRERCMHAVRRSMTDRVKSLL